MRAPGLGSGVLVSADGKVLTAAHVVQTSDRVEVAFVNGARTKLHRHTSDQILLIEAGHGVVGTPSEKHEVAAGDVVVIPAGEAHFHGASDGQDMTHYSVLGADNQTAVLE